MAAALPHPIPAEMHSGHPVVVIAISDERPRDVLVIDRDGLMMWVPSSMLTLKYPPDGPYRLLFGWAEKGKS